ncbi:MAG: LPS export ABC transporter periplasmic protein LptC [Gammaproteobacteria bacterium]|nr:LPS export ABC transporter periplasmic protein LptC [Gammaproteobacteria bacterium]
MKRFISIAVFTAAAIVVWQSTMKYYNDEDPLEKTQSKRYVEIFMNDFEMTAMDDNGKPAYILNGKHLERYNDSDETKVEQPVIHLLETGRQWLISANSALINDKNNTIQLADNVLMQQQGIEPALTIRTQSMLIHTKTQIAQTQAHVDITQGKSQLTSTGMIYNNMTSELELTSRVSGGYLPYE